MDGVFNEFGEGQLQIVSAPEETYQIFAQLYGVAQRASVGAITPQEAVAEAAKFDPRAALIFARAIELGLAVFVALMTFLMYQLQAQMNEMQKADSTSQARHQEEVIDLLSRQLRYLEKEPNPPSVYEKRNAPPRKETEEGLSPVHNLTDSERQALNDLVHPKSSKRRERRQRAKAAHRKSPH